MRCIPDVTCDKYFKQAHNIFTDVTCDKHLKQAHHIFTDVTCDKTLSKHIIFLLM